jgi:hypothetical protein
MGLSRAGLVAALALAASLMVAAPVALADARPLGVGPVVVAQPVESATPAAPTTAPVDPAGSAPADEGPATRPDIDRRMGGSEPEPGRGKPGWVWWAFAAVGIILVVGVLRLWRATAD